MKWIHIGYGNEIGFIRDGRPDGPLWGIDWRHPCGQDGEVLTYGIPFAPSDHVPAWKVEKLDPLTLSPSLQCLNCGRHGFIRGGVWIPA